MTDQTVNAALLAGNRRPLAHYQATHFLWECQDSVARITLNRPERKNPLSFESYAELRDLFQALRHAPDVRAIVLTGAGDNFCSGGDVHEIIGPLIALPAPELLMFTRMTGDLVKAMRHCPQPIVAAVDGVCAGAGAILAMASDMQVRNAARSGTAFLFVRVGLSRLRIWGPARCSRGSSVTVAPPSWTVHGSIRWEARKGRALGILQPHRGPRDAAGRRVDVRA